MNKTKGLISTHSPAPSLGKRRGEKGKKDSRFIFFAV
jgi:hypothetical protein